MNILITGGANGLGEAITKLLASNKDHFVYFTFVKSDGKAKGIENLFSNTKAIKCDFNDTNDVDSLINHIQEFKIDALINNAYVGQAVNKHLHKTNASDLVSTINSNIAPVVSITNSCVLFFRKNGGGKIISILSSFLDSTPPAGTAVYLANKAILLQLSKSWASENIKYNISSNCISPSFMLTDFTKETDERIIEELVHNHPLKKLLDPIEVAKVVEMLIASSAHLNNQNIVINANA
jgi:NAD(P)-dependent dehydrogenase (short-subunit alcohol dehydrogenase family)